MKFTTIASAALFVALLGSPALANEYEAPLKDFAAEAKTWASDPVIIAAIKAQNKKSEGLDVAAIEALDQDWRAQVGQAEAPLIASVAEVEASSFLVEKRDAAEGLITEIFIMDKVGLNVAMSDTTSDYWQGDESKFQETFGAGADAVHFSEVELDESTQTYQSQVSFTVVDPENGAPIGAVTIGVDVGYLE